MKNKFENSGLKRYVQLLSDDAVKSRKADSNKEIISGNRSTVPSMIGMADCPMVQAMK